jgi:hypothetical protein
VDHGGTAKSRRTIELGGDAGATTRRAAARRPHRAAPVSALGRRLGRRGGRDSGSASAAACDPRASGPGRPDHPGGGGVPAGATSQRGRVGRPGGGGRAGGAAPGRRRSTHGAAVPHRGGPDRLARLSALHLEELRRFAPQLQALWDGMDMSPWAAIGSGDLRPTGSWVAWVGQVRPVSAAPGQRCAGGGAARPCRRPPRTRTRTRRWLASSLPPLPLGGSYRATMFDRSTAAGYGLDDGDPAPGQHKRRHPSVRGGARSVPNHR